MELQDWLKDDDLKRCMDLHGHLCPGLAIGFVTAKEGLRCLDETRADDEQIVSRVYTDACCTDAVSL